MIDCKIVGVNQGMDFETNTATMSLVLELPDGRRVQVAADQDVLQRVLELQIGAHGVPVPTRKPAPKTASIASEPLVRANEPSAPEETTQEFGGNYTVEATDDYAAAPMPAAPETATAVEDEEEIEDEPPPAPPPKTETPKQARQRVRRNGYTPSRTVPKDEHGYPVVPQASDHEQLTSTFGQDEDGVGSV